MAESDMRQRLVKDLKVLDAISVENRVGPGTPDINYIHGWIECKWLRSWPKQAGTVVRLDHPLEQEQKVWACKRIRRGGNSWVMLQANRSEWFLWAGDVAAEVLGVSTRAQLVSSALLYWSNGLRTEELISFLRTHR